MLGCGPLLKAEDSSSVPPVSAPAADAVQAAGAPIPQEPGAQTQRERRQQLHDWSKRHLLPPIQAAVKGKPWEADALKFAEDSFAIWADVDQERTPEAWTEIAARGDEILKSGCNELTVRYYAMRDKLRAKGDKKAAATEFRRILDQLKSDPRYPKALAWVVGLNLRSARPSTTPALDAEIIDLARQSYEEGSYDGADDALFVTHILSAADLLSHNSDAMETLVKGLQKLPEWARDTILGKIEIDRAWHARGGGWANTVTEEGWRGFGDSLNKARGLLEAAWKLKPDQPYAAGEMITVVMGSESGPGGSLRLWFDRTVKARFDFPAAYTAYTWAIRPRWGGSHEEMLAFGRACAATKRYDTNVPHHFIRVLDDIGKELAMRREVYETSRIGDEVVAVDKGYAADPSQAGVKNLRLSNLVLDAWLCRKWADARAALDQMPEQKLDPALRARMVEFGTARNNVIGETLINTGPAKEDYAQARDLEKQGRYDEAAPHYAAVLKACEDQPVPRELITFFTQINETRIALEKGQWLEIVPKTADPSDWGLSTQAKCSIPEDGVLEIIGTGETTLSRWRRPLGENYEVRATFEFLSPPDKKHLFGIALGETARAPGQSVMCQFYSDQKTKGKVYVLHGFLNTKNPVFEAPLAMQNQLLVQCWEGRLNLYLNGKRVFENFKSAEGTPSDHYGEIGFGGYKLSAEEGFRVSKIAVRALKSEPVPTAAGEDQ